MEQKGPDWSDAFPGWAEKGDAFPPLACGGCGQAGGVAQGCVVPGAVVVVVVVVLQRQALRQNCSSPRDAGGQSGAVLSNSSACPCHHHPALPDLPTIGRA